MLSLVEHAAALKHNVGAALTQQLQLKKGGAQTRTAIWHLGQPKSPEQLDSIL